MSWKDVVKISSDLETQVHMELFIQLLLTRELNSNQYQQSWLSTTDDFLNTLEIVYDLCINKFLCALTKTSVYIDIHI